MHFEYFKIFSDLVEKKASPRRQKQTELHSPQSVSNYVLSKNILTLNWSIAARNNFD